MSFKLWVHGAAVVVVAVLAGGVAATAQGDATDDVFFSGPTIKGPDFCWNFSLGGPVTYPYDSDGDGVADACSLRGTRRSAVARWHALERLALTYQSQFAGLFAEACREGEESYGEPDDEPTDQCAPLRAGEVPDGQAYVVEPPPVPDAGATVFYSQSPITGPDFCLNRSLGGPVTYPHDSDGDGVADVCSLAHTRRVAVARTRALEALADQLPLQFKPLLLEQCQKLSDAGETFGESGSLDDDECAIALRESQADTQTPQASVPVSQGGGQSVPGGQGGGQTVTPPPDTRRAQIARTPEATPTSAPPKPGQNRPPTVAAPISDATLNAGSILRVYLEGTAGDTFTDPDGDSLTYSAESGDSGVATAATSGTDVVATAVNKGSATITVTASDGNGGTASLTFTITVPDEGQSTTTPQQPPTTPVPTPVPTPPPPPNQPPTVANPIRDLTAAANSTAMFDLEHSGQEVFTDPDGDSLTYSVESSDSSAVGAMLSGSVLTLTFGFDGSATITVTASDGKGGTASDAFDASVRSISN